jgi:hypothetical protein
MTMPTQKAAPTAPMIVGVNCSMLPRTLSSVPCRVLPTCMSA